jgi:hypothetical protein
MSSPRPREVCERLLAALDASEGRRRRRARDTTPDRIGLDLKRGLLERAVAADPDPEAFEAWLFERSLETDVGAGATRAVARDVLDEWRLALASPHFQAWLAQGAPSDDAST